MYFHLCKHSVMCISQDLVASERKTIQTKLGQNGEFMITVTELEEG